MKKVVVALKFAAAIISVVLSASATYVVYTGNWGENPPTTVEEVFASIGIRVLVVLVAIVFAILSK